MISISMPTFKHHTYIDQAIESILSQSYKDIELIIVPVLRDERTMRIVHGIKDERVRIVVSDYASITHQMNLGALSARGKYFMYFASDDYLLPNSLSLLYNIAVKEGASVVYPSFQVANKKLHVKKTYYPGPHSYDRIRKECFITDVSFCLTNHFKKFIPMKFEAKKNRIWNVWKEMSDGNKYKFVECEEPTFIYRQHGKNVHRENGSQGDFDYFVVGYNDNLSDFYKSVPRKKIKDIDENSFTIYFPDPMLYLENISTFKYKRSIVHWEIGNIDGIEKFSNIKNVTHISHDKRIMSIINRGTNNIFIEDERDLIGLLKEERY
jgi:glycosyltransferase involved in cell wall biosynthesis